MVCIDADAGTEVREAKCVNTHIRAHIYKHIEIRRGREDRRGRERTSRRRFDERRVEKARIVSAAKGEEARGVKFGAWGSRSRSRFLINILAARVILGGEPPSPILPLGGEIATSDAAKYA